MNNILIGLSWPYCNGELHIGHLGSSLPSDVLARYFRLKGKEVCFVTGSDCFGTPISIQAQKEKKTPEEIINYYHNKFVDVFNRLNFTFDIYSKTTSKEHIDFCKDFHSKLFKTEFIEKISKPATYCKTCNRFLPDRFVVGICPKCGERARGDNCDFCGQVLEPEELKESKCLLCGDKPEQRDNFQYYILLPKLQKQLEKYFNQNKVHWTQNAINLTKRYFDEGLINRAITRNIDWGVDLPFEDNERKIYNWAENVLGYLVTCKQWCEAKGIDFEAFYNDSNTNRFLIHAKDNIPFHTIILPSLLIAHGQYKTWQNIFAYEFVTNDGKKISKSLGTALTCDALLENFESDVLRFYFLKGVNSSKDFDFKLPSLVGDYNAYLVNNWGNLVQRVFAFIKNKFNSQINCAVIENEVEKQILDCYEVISGNIECGKTDKALNKIFELVSYANKKFDLSQPWNLIKESKDECEKLIYQFLVLIANIASLLRPFIPNGSERVLSWLNIDTNQKYEYFLPDAIVLQEFEILYKRFDV